MSTALGKLEKSSKKALRNYKSEAADKSAEAIRAVYSTQGGIRQAGRQAGRLVKLWSAMVLHLQHVFGSPYS